MPTCTGRSSEQIRKYVNSTASTPDLLSPFFHVQIRRDNGGSTVVKALCYKSEDRWFDSRWCLWNFSLTSNHSNRTVALG